MSTTILALVLYSLWTLALLTGIASWRTVLTLGGRPANRFAVDGSDVSPAKQRLCRAHANCYEHFPIIAGLLVAAELSDLSAITDDLALLVIAARVAQSAAHIGSTRPMAVVVRFGFLAVQIAIEVWWAVELLRRGLSGA